jgi:hypothetical protein
MIPTSIADEYPLRLTTGETIQIAEIDSERSPALLIPQVRMALDGLLTQCCHVSREIMEEAKGGYDTNLKPLLRSSPIGCMIKAEPAICRHIESCAMALKSICTLHNCRSNSNPLPVCWEYSLPASIAHLEIRTAIIELGTLIGHSWRKNQFVIIVWA